MERGLGRSCPEDLSLEEEGRPRLETAQVPDVASRQSMMAVRL